MTTEQIKSDHNFLCGIELKKENVAGYLLYKGTEKLQYYFFWNGALLFDGADFRPSPVYGVDTLDAMVQLLDWMVMQKGDTDKEYFNNYTPKQWEWSESSDCNDLKNLVYDYWNGDADQDDDHNPQADANDYFKSNFIN